MGATSRSKEGPSRDQNSPIPQRKIESRNDMPKEDMALRELSKKQRLLNEELWEVSSNGDLAKITQLLDP
jgi:hypothetical protein